MSAPDERSVTVNGETCRVLEAGQGEPLVFLAGVQGVRGFTPFLERLATARRVIVPSLPGFPGAEGHRKLDDLPDWVAATLDLLDACDLVGHAPDLVGHAPDLVGHAVGAALAAEVAAFSRASVRRLVLMAPFGLFDEAEPLADFWAKRPSEVPALFSTKPEAFAATLACPEGEDPIDWQVTQVRASEAAARLLWPMTDRGLRKRLHRVTAPTLLLHGSEDRIVPASYAKRFADGIRGATRVRSIEGAGHALDHDAPEAAADAILEFLG